MSTPPKDRRFPDALHGVPLRTLLGWYREPATASPEIRSLLRLPEVRGALYALRKRERERARLPRRKEAA